jgi:hypothetical protein
VTTRSVLSEKPVPLSDEDRERVVTQFRLRIERLTPGAGDHEHVHGHGSGHGHGHGHGHGNGSELPAELALPPADLAVWKALLDPDSPRYLGRRTDLAALSVRSIHVGHAPADHPRAAADRSTESIATPGVEAAGRAGRTPPP